MNINYITEALRALVGFIEDIKSSLSSLVSLKKGNVFIYNPQNVGGVSILPYAVLGKGSLIKPIFDLKWDCIILI